MCFAKVAPGTIPLTPRLKTWHNLAMQLSDKDGNILNCVALQGNLEVPEICRQTGLKQHTVRYALGRLREAGVITVYPFIDMYTLGYVQYDFRFRLWPAGIRGKKKLLDWLIKSPRLAFLGEVSGLYDYCATVCVKNLEDLNEFFENLAANFGDLIADKDISPRLSFNALRCRLFSSVDYGPKYLRFGVSNDRAEIDETDHRILQLMDRDGWASKRTIAKTLGMNLSTLAYRIKALEKNRVIRGYDTVIRCSNLGRMSSYMLLLRVHGIPSELRKKLLNYAVTSPHISFLVEAIGAWDFNFGVNVFDSRDIVSVLDNLQEAFGKEIQEITTLSYHRALKVSRYPFDTNCQK